MARTKPESEPRLADAVDPVETHAAGYTVIARRYRPQRFEDVVGQDHVVQSLRNAIRLDRVTHAYLFAGTRGVGKTSLARIFAKCLNCVKGPTDSPCLECDICRAIAVGQDVDVIEIDGASNNGVESVRELRQNAGLRPSRARYKIYYIDEVHMLSTGAFNALLKTLEEPPEHVKFFFATTEPNRIPITVLSRCQRYDLAGITPEQVTATLAEICAREKVSAEPEALRALARRAGGSMRDAQSLLEQLLSGGGETLTVELVHKRLGTASDERLLALLECLAQRDAAGALRNLAAACDEGVQPADLLNGLLDFLRDSMALAAGAGETLLAVSPRQKPRLESAVEKWTLDSILAALQILAEARTRMRGSPHGRLLTELALVRAARLENLSELSELVARLVALETGQPQTSTAAKKKPEPAPTQPLTPLNRPPAPSAPSPPAPPANATTTATLPTTSLELDSVRQSWPALVKKVGVRLGVPLTQAERFLAISAPNSLVIKLPGGYNGSVLECDTPEARGRIEQVLTALLHRPVTLTIERTGGDGPTGADPQGEPVSTQSRRREDFEGDPMVRKVVELFEARPLHFEWDEGETSP